MKIPKIFLPCVVLIGYIFFTITTVNAGTYGQNYGIFTYDIEDGEVRITYCDDTVRGTVDIPSEINGYPVTAIGTGAFENCFDITSVSLPSTLYQIGNDAFSGCYNLQEINFPSNLTRIGQWAFYGCSSLSEVDFPESLTTIAPYAFSNCEGLTSVTLPSGITTIYQNSFANCGITSLTIYNNIAEIRTKAFYGCNLESINYYGLENEWNSINIAENNAEILNANIITNIKSGNYQYRIENNAATIVKSEKINGEVIIPNSLDGYNVVKIGEKAFYNNQSITGVVIPDTVSHIEKFAFSCCYNLTDVVLSNKLNFIGEQAFTWCSFESINLPESLVHIKWGAFAGCASLKEITIPKGVEEISDNVFSLCTKLKKILLPHHLKPQVANMGLSNNTRIYYVYRITYILNDDTKIISYVPENTDATHSELPSIPVGYMYRYYVDGVIWNGKSILCDTIVNVNVVPAEYVVSYTGDYEGSVTVIHGNDVILPKPSTGHLYHFTVNGIEWDGKNITEDVTVIVTKEKIKYTICLKGAISKTLYVPYMENTILPTAPDGYIYKFTVNGNEWDGTNVTNDTIVMVTQLCDKAELEITNLINITTEENVISGIYYDRTFVHEISISENAVYKIYSDELCENELTEIILSRGENQFYIKVIAESGRTEIYVVNIYRDIPIELGTLTVIKTTGGNINFTVENTITGKPQIVIFYGNSQDNLNYSQIAEFNTDTQTISVSGLPENTEYNFKAVADYGDITAESSTILEKTGITLSSECEILYTITPPDGTVTEGENGGVGSVSNLRVTNKFDSIAVDVSVSSGATWNLYKTATATKPVANREMTLIAGRNNNAYIRVVAEDGEHTNTYLISIYRQSKSTAPTITAFNGVATISAADNSTIIYTTDGTEPDVNNGNEYTGSFSVSAGTKISAIAKQNDKDEYSDVETLIVAQKIETSISEIYISEDVNNKYDYEFYIEAPETLTGQFIITAYSGEKFVGLDSQAISLSEDSVYGSLYATEKPDNYKVFIWSSLTTLIPLCESVSGNIN